MVREGMREGEKPKDEDRKVGGGGGGGGGERERQRPPKNWKDLQSYNTHVRRKRK